MAIFKRKRSIEDRHRDLRTAQVKEFITTLKSEDIKKASDFYNENDTAAFVTNSILIAVDAINNKGRLISTIGKVSGASSDDTDTIQVDLKKAMIVAALTKAFGKEAFDREL